MEKIKLKNGQEFELIPMGISTDNIMKRREFAIMSELPFEEIKAIFSNIDNISEIHYTKDNLTSKTYADCVGFKSIKLDTDYKIDENTITDIYIVELSIDAMEKELNELNEELKAQQNEFDSAIAELTIMLALVTPKEEE